MTDLTPFLVNALSNDNNLRQAAEAKLRQAREQNLALFMVTLVLIMANENKEKEARQMAGIILKNEMKGRSEKTSLALSENWKKLDDNLKTKIRTQVVKTLHSKFYEVRKISASVLANIASIDLYMQKWIQVITILQKNITHASSSEGAESSLMAIGYLCEQCKAPLLEQQSNVLLTAVFHGMRSKNFAIKLAGTDALFNCLDFAKNNFQKQEHRNFIMKSVMECAVCGDLKVRKSACECLVQIACRYYPFLSIYMDAITNLTMKLVTEDKEEVGMQGIEFWSTLSEVEADIIEEEEECRELRRQPKRKCFSFVKGRLAILCKVLTSQLVKQTEEYDAWNVAAAAAKCLSLISKVVGDSIVKHVIQFIRSNMNHNDWHQREAAILAFSAIVDGPKSDNMNKLITMAIPHLLNHVKDQVLIVRDTTVFCIGRICKFQCEPIIDQFLSNVLQAFTYAMQDKPNIAEKACWGVLNIASFFDNEKNKNSQTNALSKFFQTLCETLLKVTLRSDIDTGNLRINSYEALSRLIRVATPDCYNYLDQRIAGVIIQRLFETLKGMNSQNKEKIFLIQGLLCGALENATEKLGPKMGRFSDNLMRAYLTILKNNAASVIDEVFMAISSLATSLGENFVRYMDSFQPFLLRALRNQQMDDICVAAVWSVVDISYAIKKKMTKYTDDIVRVLLTNLQSSNISRDIKPLIIACFGDIAMGIGDDFQKYVLHISAVLKNAANADVNRKDDEMLEYLNTLRENIFDAYIGILQGVKKENFNIFNPFVKPLIEFIGRVYKDQQSDQEVVNKACSAIGDLVNVYGAKCKDYINFPFIKNLIHECSNSNDPETKKIANWTKKQITKNIK